MDIKINSNLIKTILFDTTNIKQFIKNSNNNTYNTDVVAIDKEQFINNLIKQFLLNPKSKEDILKQLTKHNIITTHIYNTVYIYNHNM